MTSRLAGIDAVPAPYPERSAVRPPSYPTQETEEPEGARDGFRAAALERCTRPVGSLAVRVLVTGGAGFIGSNLVDALLGQGADVRVLDNFSTGIRSNLNHVLDDVQVVEGDLCSYERVHHAVRGCDYVFHQGALPSVPRSIQDPLTSTAVNVGGTLNVLLSARSEDVKRVVFASSSSVYGDAPGYPRDEAQQTLPLAPYAVSKLAAEHFCRVATRVYGLETVSLRYFNVFGRRQDPASQYSAVVPRFISAIARGESPAIYGDGRQSRDFTHIDNVIAANLKALTADAAGQAFNIACGEEYSLLALVDILNDILGTNVRPQHLAARPGDIRHSRANIDRAVSQLSYHVSVPLREGLARTVDSHADLHAGP